MPKFKRLVFNARIVNQIKTLHDWVVRYALLTIPGVSEINSWGGETKQYTIVVGSESLRRYNLRLHEVVMAVYEQ